jgi:hypothetical protein
MSVAVCAGQTAGGPSGIGNDAPHTGHVHRGSVTTGSYGRRLVTARRTVPRGALTMGADRDQPAGRSDCGRGTPVTTDGGPSRRSRRSDADDPTLISTCARVRVSKIPGRATRAEPS